MPTAVIVTTACPTTPCSNRPAGGSLIQLGVTIDGLTHAGWTPLIASPAGGPAPFDPREDAAEWVPFVEHAEATVPLGALDVDGADLVLVLGGPGAVHDLAEDADVRRLVVRTLRCGRPLIAIGHGVAALAATSIVAGRRVTGCTDAEELVALRRPAASSTERRLRAAGARFYARPPGRPHLVVEGHLVTAQNTASIGLAVVHALTIARPLAHAA